jgi:hypothetical protein
MKNQIITIVVGTVLVTVVATTTLQHGLEPHIQVDAFNPPPLASAAVLVSGNSAIGNAELIHWWRP